MHCKFYIHVYNLLKIVGEAESEYILLITVGEAHLADHCRRGLCVLSELMFTFG